MLDFRIRVSIFTTSIIIILTARATDRHIRVSGKGIGKFLDVVPEVILAYPVLEAVLA